MPFRWACWYFPSVCQSVDRPVMPLIQRGILARVLRTPFFPSRARETVIGLTHGYRYSVPLRAVRLPPFFSICFLFKISFTKLWKFSKAINIFIILLSSYYTLQELGLTYH